MSMTEKYAKMRKCSSARIYFLHGDVEAWKKEAPPPSNETWTFPLSSTIMTVFLPNEPVHGIVSDPKFYDQKTSDRDAHTRATGQ
jgi:hypothetical protein